MMHLFLAQSEADQQTANSAVKFVKNASDRLDILHHPEMLLDSLADVPMMAAAIMVTVGLLCVFNGYRWHRWVIMVLAFLGGIGIGKMVGDRFGESAVVAIALGAMCAIIANPMLKIAVAIFSGLTGAFIGANVWTALNADSADLHWAGAAMGFIALAMASVIVFRLMIVLFTSVGGAAMVVFGVITLLLQVEGWESKVRESLLTHELLIPIVVSVAAIAGFVLQQGRVRAQASGQPAHE